MERMPEMKSMGRFLYIPGIKLGKEELSSIRKKLRCKRISKLRMIKLKLETFDALTKGKGISSFIHYPLGGFYYIYGRPASSEEINQIYPEGIDDNFHVIKIVPA